MLKILQNKTHLTIAIVVLWQLISIGLMATGVWPDQIAVINTVLLALLFIWLKPVDALGLFVISLPFMVIVPNSILANLPMWRPLVVWLYLVIALKFIVVNRSNAIESLKRLAAERSASWDKWLLAFLLLTAVSLVMARFPAHGLKQVLFLVNVGFLYGAVLFTIGNKVERQELLRYLKASLLFTVALGFIQFGASLFASSYYFWQYWAQLVSGHYYGQPLADVLSYSNSWFSSNSGDRSIRMFGILQDTHAFAVLVIFTLGLWLSEIKFSEKISSVRELLFNQTARFWIGLVLLCFAIVASGTRGAWIAMLVPAVVAIGLAYQFKAKLLTVFPLLAYFLVIVLFALSPFISQGLNLIRSINLDDNFLDRASSIYDFSESSNVGRLEIWKSSLAYAAAHPLGTGYGNFIVSIVNVADSDSYQDVAEKKDLKLNLPEKFVTAHSLYLHILVELGIVGIILLAGICLSALKQVWLRLRSSNFQLNQTNLLVVNITLALLWLLAYGLFDVTILNERVLLYLMVILAVLNLTLKETNSQN